MFNLLISGDDTAWESGPRMRISADRFGEYSGDEFDAISLTNPKSLKALERVHTLLMYESGVSSPGGDVVRVGQVRDIRSKSGDVTFRFVESGRLDCRVVEGLRQRLGIDSWEFNRTHWAIKDGDLPQDLLRTITEVSKQYDIVLSFAGEDRGYVSQVADILSAQGVEVFYDEYEKVTLWGKDLVEHLDSVYRNQARFCVMFISKHYADKVWTSHERKSALARALENREEYILPARFDDTAIPGLRPTVGYVDLRTHSPSVLARLILQKLGRQ